MSINFLSPSTLTTAFYVTDTVTNQNGSNDSIPAFPRATAGAISATGDPLSAGICLSSTVGGLYLGPMTTAQRDALNAAPGMVIYNSTTNALNVYVTATGWVALGTTGGGAISESIVTITPITLNTTAGQVRFQNNAGTFYTSLTGGGVGANIGFVLPTTVGTVGQVLITNGASPGVLSWATTPPSIGNLNVAGDGAAAPGTITLNNIANTFATTLQSGATAANPTFVLPATVGSANQILVNSGAAGTLTFSPSTVVATTKTLTGTAASGVDASITVAGTITAVAFAASFTTPVALVLAAAIGANTVLVVDEFRMEMIYGTSAFTNAGNTQIVLGYGAAQAVTEANPALILTTTDGLLQATASTMYYANSTNVSNTKALTANTGLYLTVNTADLTPGVASTTVFNWALRYHLVTVT